MSIGDMSGFSMLDLFRMEAGEQARVLTDGLLRLERGDADAALLDSMMRAAHSIKGAAAIVGMEAVVRLSHVMEDVFIAAQHGRLALDAAGADRLLAAVDLMLALAEAPEGAADESGLDAMLDALAAVQRGEAAPVSAPAPASTPAPALPAVAAVSPSPAAAAPGVQAAAEVAPAPAPTLPGAAAGAGEDLLTLAGQARLHAGQLRPWLDALQRYKRQQRGAWDAVARLQEAIALHGDAHLRELVELLEQRARPLRDDLHRIIVDAENYERQAASVGARLVDEARALRMCRFSEGVHGLPRMVRDLARGLGKDARMVIEGADTLVDRAVLARIEGPLNQLLRNAVDHGLETPEERLAAGKPAAGTLHLAARHRGGMLAIEVRDDGRGVDPERIRGAAVARQLAPAALAHGLSQEELMEFLFLPGFSLKESANEMSGRGVGMDVVYEAAQRLGGSVRAESRPGAGFTTVITLPLTQSIVRALVVDVAGEAYALPIARVERVLRLAREDIRTLSGREYLDAGGVHLGLVAASQVLDLGEAAPGEAVVVIGAGRERYGLVVERVRGEQSLSVQPLEPVFGKLRDVAAGALLDDGTPALVLDVPDLLVSIARLLDQGATLNAGRRDASASSGPVRRILVVDDSMTVREMQRKLLAARGYRVDVALDGIDGWNSLRGTDYDLVITDIDMPRLDGIGLLGRIRQDPRLQRLPVMIVSYKDRPEDRARGMEAGADYYLAKGGFHDATLLDAVRDLVGPAQPGGGQGA